MLIVRLICLIWRLIIPSNSIRLRVNEPLPLDFERFLQRRANNHGRRDVGSKATYALLILGTLWYLNITPLTTLTYLFIILIRVSQAMWPARDTKSYWPSQSSTILSDKLGVKPLGEEEFRLANGTNITRKKVSRVRVELLNNFWRNNMANLLLNRSYAKFPGFDQCGDAVFWPACSASQ